MDGVRSSSGPNLLCQRVWLSFPPGFFSGLVIGRALRRLRCTPLCIVVLCRLLFLTSPPWQLFIEIPAKRCVLCIRHSLSVGDPLAWLRAAKMRPHLHSLFKSCSVDSSLSFWAFLSRVSRLIGMHGIWES